MAELWVVNASPLIALCAVNHEHLLDALADRYVVPESVIEELAGNSKTDRAYSLAISGQLPVVSDPVPAREVLQARLGPGETDVLSFAWDNSGWTAIVDDKAARRCAHLLGLQFKGVIAIALLAQDRGIIPSARELLRAVKAAGYYLDDRLIAAALRSAFDELW